MSSSLVTRPESVRAGLPFTSYLYVPAFRADAAAERGAAGAVVLDLEHLTPDEDKAEGRRRATAYLEAARWPVLVRVNHPSTGLVEQDLDAIVRPGLHAVRLPKTEHPDEVRHVARLIEELRVERGLVRTIGLQVMVETARGVESIAALARATHTVWGVGLGEGDLSADLGTRADEGLALSRSSVVLAARSAGLPAPVQVTYGGAPDGLRPSTELGRRLGFGSRTVLDPAYAETVNEIYG
ncbi:CoA ester lyase [Pseudonocardia sp. WMMC193]|uniref:HpcH/HpaI aldolase/citrate lyase family protein n=1 Tax=Pseudonocardia sp. WMMC193 TaxID=2911965 RepID=UPI001F023523|nr:aldolase/citrate lyase family protein [Pseudonocardia sp. WMMC193]MCF7550632.1 aldolase/citrate lyase family protein [Pseudonocardia sp. WMMC193]